MTRIARWFLIALLPMAAWAQQTLILRDGTQFRGRMTGATDNSISFRDRDGGTRTFDIDRVDTIRFEQGGADNSSRAGQNYDRESQNHEGMTLPAGTSISVRSGEAINTQEAAESRTYSAEVSQDVVDANGNIAVPRGSEARLMVRKLGDGNLALDLQSVSVNGRRYLVDTSDVIQGTRREGVGGNKRTAEFGGGGAALGTLLGAIAGGGKGAAIGALAGGAAGIGAQVLTRGNAVRVPAETILNFRLDSPVSLRPER